MKCLRIEIQKALNNKLFWLVIIIGCLISILSFLYNWNIYIQDKRWTEQLVNDGFDVNPHIGMYTLYNHWIGGESFSLGTEIFFTILPLLSALPFGWSFCEEKKTGYLRVIIVKTNRFPYYLSKYTAVFLSGGLAVLLPLLFNLLLTAMFFPAIKPEVIYDTNYAVFSMSFMAKWYYTCPFIYIIAYLALDFIFSGLLACLCLLFTYFISSQWMVTLTPFIVCFAIHYFREYLYHSDERYEISPLYFLRGAETSYPANGLIIAEEILILFAVTIGCMTIKRRNHDVF